MAEVRPAITFCRHVKPAILGLGEKMSGLLCPCCGAGGLPQPGEFLSWAAPL